MVGTAEGVTEKERKKAKITSWEKMKKKMKENFLPFPRVQTLYNHPHSLRQGSTCIVEYTEGFNQLLSGTIYLKAMNSKLQYIPVGYEKI